MTKFDYDDYTYSTSADTVEECAVFCYRRACSAAQFVPHLDAKIVGGKCYLRFTDVNCPQEFQPNIINVESKTPVILKCFTCGNNKFSNLMR